MQIPVFQSHPRTQVIAVSSGHAERAEKTAKDHGISAHYTNFEEMLDKQKPDLVSIVTPPDLHFPMTMAALSREIHVLCEKPFAMNLDEARQMKREAENAKVVAMIDYEFRALLTHMVRAIEKRLPSPSPNFADGANSQAVLDAARLSACQGIWVEVSKP